jgi:hypothetical protein
MWTNGLPQVRQSGASRGVPGSPGGVWQPIRRLHNRNADDAMRVMPQVRRPGASRGVSGAPGGVTLHPIIRLHNPHACQCNASHVAAGTASVRCLISAWRMCWSVCTSFPSALSNPVNGCVSQQVRGPGPTRRVPGAPCGVWLLLLTAVSQRQRPGPDHHGALEEQPRHALGNGEAMRLVCLAA